MTAELPAGLLVAGSLAGCAYWLFAYVWRPVWAAARAERQAKRARWHLRLCIDCAHHRPATAPATPGLTVDYCGHPRANTCPVDGTVGRHWSKSLCSNLRTDPHQCGVQGRWWKRKD
jgi:hypothetical protein